MTAPADARPNIGPHTFVKQPAPTPPVSKGPVVQHRVVQFQIVDDDLIALDTMGQLWTTKVRCATGRSIVGRWERLPGPLDGAG